MHRMRVIAGQIHPKEDIRPDRRKHPQMLQVQDTLHQNEERASHHDNVKPIGNYFRLSSRLFILFNFFMVREIICSKSSNEIGISMLK